MSLLFTARSVVFDVIGRDVSGSRTFSKVGGAADLAATRVDRAISKTNIAAARVQGVGQRMSKAITLPLVAVAAVGVKQAIEVEKQNTLLRTAVGESETNMRQISKGITKVSEDTYTSLHSLYEGMYVIGKASKSRGWTGSDQLLILKAAAQGAKAENVGLGTATDALTTIMVDYHTKASDAVKVENQLVKASGLAKTNFGLFSESLSNVTPIAAAAHISIAEVTGAIATMTQHGVAPQRATQNAANLIYNLSGQNNVASQAMQQLGINTVDLAKNLGKRGLTGTLAIVDRALRAHTKDGMVVTDVHKAAALATKSLGTMVGGFTGRLKTNSKALLSGKMSLREYQLYARSMGGQNGVEAMQFLGLTKNALGFSNQLKAGKGTLSTTTQQYQKLLGGMTGASVGMQIAGRYAKDNAKNVREIGKEAKHTGADVHGWELTQKTLNSKLQNAGNKVSLLTTEAGKKLLPVLGKLADWGLKAFKWFDGLDSGTKKILGISLLIGAGLGPALALVGRLTRGFTLLWRAGVGAYRLVAGIRMASLSLGAMDTGAYRTGIRIRTFFNRMRTQGITAARGIGAAFAGAGLGTLIGSAAGSTVGGTGGKLIGGLGGLAAGALAGAAVGGPVGAVIGGAIGGITGLVSAWGDEQKAAGKSTSAIQRFMAEQKAAASDLLDTLQSVSGAYTAQYRQQLAHSLAGKGVLRTAAQAGLKPGQVLDTIIGKGGSNGIAGVMAKIENAQASGKISWKAGGALIKQIQQLSPAAATAEANLQSEAREMGRNLLSANQLGTSVKKLRAAFVGTGTALGTTTAAGTRNDAVIRENVNSINANATAQLAHGKSVRSVATAYESQIGTLTQNLTKLGFNRAEVVKLIGSYGKIPKKVATDLLKRGVLPADIQAIIAKYDLIPRSKVTVISARDSAAQTINSLQAQLNALTGKKITITTELRTVHAADHKASDPKASANGNIFYARGGMNTGRRERHIAQIAPAGAWRVWAEDETGGEAYIPLARSKRARSRAIALETVRRLGGVAAFAKGGIVHKGKDWLYGGTSYASKRAAVNAQNRAKKGKSKDRQDALASGVSNSIGGIGQASSPPFSVADVGIGRVLSTARSAASKLADAIAAGLKSKTARAFRRQIAGLVRTANAQLGGLRAKIRGGDLTSMRRAFKGTGDDIRTALSQTLSDIAHAGGSARTVGRLRGLGNRIASTRDRLNQMTEYRGTIADTLRGAYDITQSGSFEDLHAGLTGATSANNGFASKLNSLRNKAKGNKSLLAFITRLQESGNTTTLDTLSGLSNSELAQVSKDTAAYDQSVSAGADAATTTKYGQSVATLTAQMASMTKVFGAALVAIGRQDVTVVLDGEKVATKVTRSKAFDKAMADLEHELSKHN